MRVSTVFVLHIQYANEGRSDALHSNAIPRSGQSPCRGRVQEGGRMPGGVEVGGTEGASVEGRGSVRRKGGRLDG